MNKENQKRGSGGVEKEIENIRKKKKKKKKNVFSTPSL